MSGVKGQVQKRGADRRRAILDAAAAHFSKAGFRGTGIAAVAERAGVTPSGVLHHFGTKEGLLRAVVEDRDARETERMAHVFRQGGLVALRALVDVARHIESEPKLAAITTILEVENLAARGAEHRYFLARSRWIREALVICLEFGVRRGEIRKRLDLAAKADEIAAFIEGAQLLWLLDPRRVSLVKLYETYVDSLCRDLAT